jgi:formylglycine-generating enzyme
MIKMKFLVKFMAILIFAVAINFSGCNGSSSGDGSASGNGNVSENSAPIAGAAINFSNIASTSGTISWGAAADNKTVGSKLSYKLVKSTSSSSIDTFAEADAITGSDMIMDWSMNVLTCQVNSLNHLTKYYFAVIVKDEAGNKALYSPSSFITPGTFDDAGAVDIGPGFSMRYVPGGFTFPIGCNDSGSATVTSAYWMAITAVTFELWNIVNIWATTDAGNGKRTDGGVLYSFANPGFKGGGSGVGSSTQYPVTCISWRDSMIWCNALTEWYNAHAGTTYDCAYYSDSGYTTPIRSVDDSSSLDTTPGHEDNPYVKATATGFRLPTSNEWELAARYRGTDTVNSVLMNGFYWTKGNSASGATTYYNDVAGGPNYAGKLANDSVAVYSSYWDGANWIATGITGTAVVASRNPNSLGLCNMSGNVAQWCFENSGSYRIFRGGSWYYNADSLQIGSMALNYSYHMSGHIGLRFVRTAQ